LNTRAAASISPVDLSDFILFLILIVCFLDN
jgi:hypothetical protein